MATRRSLAGSLIHLLDISQGRGPRPGAAVPINRGEVRRCRSLVMQLAEELVGEGPVTPRGMLKLRSLLRDGASPVYMPSVPAGTLELELRHTRTMLFLL
ncbi:MAG TPA: hypothetical protein VGF21_14470 [Thermoleophilaceae bacterium]|jgi:hypothetical protein